MGPLKFERYNNKWLKSNKSPVTTTTCITKKPPFELDTIAFTPHHTTPTARHPILPSDNAGLQSPILCLSSAPIDPIQSSPSKLSPLDSFHTSLVAFTSKLLFIRYQPVGTMIRCWYLIRVWLDGSVALNTDFASTGQYYCEFLAKHKDDANCSDKISRWWPNWYCYSCNSVTHNIVFGSCTLIRPSFAPNHTNYILWADTIDLDAPYVILHGPFDFNSITSSNRTRNLIASEDWW